MDTTTRKPRKPKPDPRIIRALLQAGFAVERRAWLAILPAPADRRAA